MKLYRIEVPTPFQVGTVNAYLMAGNPLTLFDCGPNTEEAYMALADGIQQCGYRLHDIEQIIISHHHVDHVGLLHRIVAESDATLIAHEYAVPYLQNPITARQRDNDFFHIICQEGGVPESMLTVVDKVTGWVERFVNQPVTVDRVVQECHTVTAGDREWQVYHTPGHAGDMVCLFEPQTATLLSSDHLLLKISSNPLIEPAPTPGASRPRRLIEYITHLQRIADLQPRIAYPGHGEPIEDVVGLVAERVQMHHQRARKILDYMGNQPVSLWELTEKLFGHIQQPEGKFLAISEVLGHIDLLESSGEIVRCQRDGVICWQREIC